ncbi:MAG: UDP-N-acetylmuramoyl-tripeptide--D-alanyl-D-alanine ligase [Patescibacteria group bacterium]|nr:UDP-N-acetylmuramoyl-tripeptide--D-alanyl-D-alanine ligase [Patescibacteria group bacterium]
MIKKLISRYRPRLVRSLVYMLQASEYNIRDYLAWVYRTRDFAHVEKRGHLERTPKVLALLSASWSFLVIWAAGLMGYAVFTDSNAMRIALVAALLLLPLYFPYVLALIVLLMQAAQKPVEYALVARAKRTLRAHKGVRIAIAGSYGKTSMREILKTVLAEGKKVAAPPGSYNTPLGIARFVKTLTGKEDVIIFELGEYYPGDVRALAHIVRPDWGIITGINEAHLDKFKTLERTADTIFELAEFVEPSHLYVNGENELARVHSKSGNVVYQREGAGAWGIDDAKTVLSGTTFKLTKRDDGSCDAASGLLGLHMLGPLALASDIASKLGLSNEEVVRGIAKTKPFAHRLEPKDWGDGVTFLDDSYNGNPDGVKAVIDFLASLKSHRRWYVTPGLVEMGARTEEVHRAIGRQLAEAGIERIVLIRDSVTPYIEKGLHEAGYKGVVTWYDDMPQALQAIRHGTAAGDIVLIQNDWPDQYS